MRLAMPGPLQTALPPQPGTAARSSLPSLYDCLWEWTHGLEPGRTAPFPTAQGSVLHAGRSGTGLRLTLLGGHRTIVYEWADRADLPRLVAPFGLRPSVEAPNVWRSAMAHHVEFSPGGALFDVQVPCL